MKGAAVAGLICVCQLATSAPAPLRIVPTEAPAAKAALPIKVVGRVQSTRDAAGRTIFRRQWPGSYFETAFRGDGVVFGVGDGDVILRVQIDGRAARDLVKPKPGYYGISGLGAGAHHVRIDVVTEDQAAPTVFGGIYAARGTTRLPLPVRARQIEFIGDSHTVGYGNTSPVRDCTTDAVWKTTDTARGIAAVTAARYGADYQDNAISGRGIVRNYAGAPGDTVPTVYPYVLFDKIVRYADPAWRPSVIVMALGTNDFSTALKPGEAWATRAALHGAYEATYARFIRDLRARNQQALIVLWATDMADGEIESESRIVVDRLRAGGDGRIVFVPVHGLAFSACHAHPGLADDRAIAAAIGAAIGAWPNVWTGR